MENKGPSISRHGIENQGVVGARNVYWNLPAAMLYEHAIRNGEAIVAADGPLVALTGDHTGRAPNDKFVVKAGASADNVWWGAANLPLDMAVFGAPGCFIWNDPLLRIPLVTDTNGRVTTSTAVPPSANFGTIFAHWWVLDTSANAFGVTSSDYATIILGN